MLLLLFIIILLPSETLYYSLSLYTFATHSSGRLGRLHFSPVVLLVRIGVLLAAWALAAFGFRALTIHPKASFFFARFLHLYTKIYKKA